MGESILRLPNARPPPSKELATLTNESLISIEIVGRDACFERSIVHLEFFLKRPNL